MPVTQTQINNAADLLALGKLQATIANETAATLTADAADASADRTTELTQQLRGVVAGEQARDAAVTMLAKTDRMVAAAERQAAALEQQATLAAAETLSADKQAYLKVFETCLRVRLGPAQITSATTDAVLNDMVLDAGLMAEKSWELLKPKLDTLA